MSMCSSAEIQQRIAIGDYDVFETNGGRPDPALFVKRYLRDAVGGVHADNPAQSIRPPFILLKTFQHLQCNVIARVLASFSTYTNNQLLAWFEFLDDRFRAIRKDLRCQQAAADDSVLKILHGMLEYYLCASCELRHIPDFSLGLADRGYTDTYALWEHYRMLVQNPKQSVLPPSSFSPKNEVVSKHDSIQPSDTRGSDVVTDIKSASKTQQGTTVSSQYCRFDCDVLYRPRTNMSSGEINSNAGQIALAVSVDIFSQPKLSSPRRVLCNYVRARRLLQESDTSTRYAFFRHINVIRASILDTMMKAFTLSKTPLKIPVETLARVLFFTRPSCKDIEIESVPQVELDNVIAFVQAFGLRPTENRDDILLNRLNYTPPASEEIPWTRPTWIQSSHQRPSKIG
eukprot:m.97843 g.97843  ORF g.97843 m.97843 type:complete len:401 (-) comp14845_c0_seq3:60-1262(-)